MEVFSNKSNSLSALFHFENYFFPGKVFLLIGIGFFWKFLLPFFIHHALASAEPGNAGEPRR